MNKWTEKSIEVGNSKGYLDRLSEVYEMQINPKRPIPEKIIPEIKKAFEDKNAKKLIKLLIDYAEVFPVKDSYIGFLRAKEQAFDENPKTVKRIAERIYSLGFDGMIKEATRPKETNRQLGPAFKNWIHNNLGYRLVDENEFLENDKETLILKGSDKFLAKFAREKLGCELRKGIDMTIKKEGVYVIGEAKFLTTPGGEQDRGFDDAMGFINENTGEAIRVAILDGYIWLKKLLRDEIKDSKSNIMSTLLLREFIESL